MPLHGYRYMLLSVIENYTRKAGTLSQPDGKKKVHLQLTVYCWRLYRSWCKQFVYAGYTEHPFM